MTRFFLRTALCGITAYINAPEKTAEEYSQTAWHTLEGIKAKAIAGGERERMLILDENNTLWNLGGVRCTNGVTPSIVVVIQPAIRGPVPDIVMIAHFIVGTVTETRRAGSNRRW